MTCVMIIEEISHTGGGMGSKSALSLTNIQRHQYLRNTQYMVEYCAPSQGEVKSNYRYCVPCGSTKSPLQGTVNFEHHRGNYTEPCFIHRGPRWGRGYSKYLPVSWPISLGGVTCITSGKEVWHGPGQKYVEYICRYRFPLTLPADQPYHWMESVVIMLEQLVVFLSVMLGPKW